MRTGRTGKNWLLAVPVIGHLRGGVAKAGTRGSLMGSAALPAECQGPLLLRTWGKVPGSSLLVLGGELKFNVSTSGSKETTPVTWLLERVLTSGWVQGTVTGREVTGSSNSHSPLTLCTVGGRRWSLSYSLLSVPWFPAMATSLWAMPLLQGGLFLPGREFTSSCWMECLCHQGEDGETRASPRSCTQPGTRTQT